MRHLKVTDSSNVHSVGYDFRTSTLEVTFKRETDAVYRYRNVRATTFLEFISAASMGKYLAQHLKHLEFEKVMLRPAHDESSLEDQLRRSLPKRWHPPTPSVQPIVLVATCCGENYNARTTDEAAAQRVEQGRDVHYCDTCKKPLRFERC